MQDDTDQANAEDSGADQHDESLKRPDLTLIVENNEDENVPEGASSSSENEVPSQRSPVLKKVQPKKVRQLRNAQKYRANKKVKMTADPHYNASDEKFVVACTRKAVNEFGPTEIKKLVNI